MQSFQPWQVQSGIAAIAVIVTVALTTLGWVMAMRTAKRLQDRDREHRQRSVALALLAEVRRIRAELGPPPNESLELSIYGSKAMVPEISHWVETVMVDAAAVDPEIVELFMTLDRQLHNLRGDQENVSQASDERDGRREAVTRLKASMDWEGDAEALAGRVGMYTTTLAALEGKQRQAENAVDRLERMRSDMDQAARQTLDNLRTKLQLHAAPPLAHQNHFRQWRDRIWNLREKQRLLK